MQKLGYGKRKALPFARTPLCVLMAMLAPVASASADAERPTEPASAGVESGAPRAQLETVVVTATRRREVLREVPMQVNVMSAQALEASGASNLTDYMALQPGIDVKTVGGAGLGSVNIRGVTTGAQSIATVGMYVDDVAFGSSTAYANGASTALDMALLDLRHVEVLRGPQGTLYGAGAMGGLVKYITNEPDTFDFSGRASLGFSSVRSGKASSTLSGVVNVPFASEVAAVRVAAFKTSEGGSIRSVGPYARDTSNDGSVLGARVVGLVTPDFKTKVKLSFTSQEIEKSGYDYVDYDVTTGRPVIDDRSRQLVLPEPYRVRVGLLGLDIERDTAIGRFNSITSVQELKLDLISDYSLSYGPLLNSFGLPVREVAISDNTRQKRKSQEFRLTSKGDGDFEWLAGFYYNNEEGDKRQLGTTKTPDGTAGPDIVVVHLPSKYIERAFYGNVTYQISPKVSLTAGLRHAQNRQLYTQRSSGLLLGGEEDFTSSSAEKKTTYLLTSSYALTKDSNLYFRAASGYRPGGPNAATADPVTGEPVAPPTFKSDSLWSYEFGYKADYPRMGASVEAVVYQIDWNKIQQFIAVNGVRAVVNAGKARIRGGELIGKLKLTPALELSASSSFIDARLTEDAPGLAQAGARLPNSAKISATLGLRYETSLFGLPGYLSVQQRAVGERNAGLDDNGTQPNFKLPGYGATDIVLSAKRADLELTAFVRNAFNRTILLNADTGVTSLGAPAWVTPGAPRTIGVSLSKAF